MYIISWTMNVKIKNKDIKKDYEIIIAFFYEKKLNSKEKKQIETICQNIYLVYSIIFIFTSKYK